MFHRITLEAGKFNGVRPVKPHSNAAQLPDHDGGETTSRRDHRHYDELHFEKEPESCVRGKIPVIFLLYLTMGTLYYDLSPANGIDLTGVLGFYQVRKGESRDSLCVRRFSPCWIDLDSSFFIKSILIGHSIGLSPQDPEYA
jgi:hypothetical protein